MSNVFFTSNNASNATIVASATGHDGYAHGVISGASLDDTIKAIATSATTQAVINLEGSVGGGSVTADGNAQIYIDGATLSGATLQTIGANAAIGVFGGGSATVTSATVSKGSFIFDEGTLTFSGGAAQAAVTFQAYDTLAASPDGALTLSDVTLGAGDRLLADDGGRLVVSATAGNTITFGSGTLVEATGASVDIYGSGAVTNSGTMEALAVGGDSAAVNVSGGPAASFTNAKGALVEAEAISGYFSGTADVSISVGGSAANYGTMQAVAGAGDGERALLTISAGTFTNEKGAKLSESAVANGEATLDIFGSGGVTNLGTIAGVSSQDSGHRIDKVAIETDGGPIVNSGTISVAATTNSQDELVVDDNNSSGGSLTNAKGASIALSATTGGAVHFSIAINSGGTLTNSGSILFTASGDSSVTGDSFAAGAIVNYGTINMMATNNAYAGVDGFNLLGTNGGLTNSGGTIDAIANNGARAQLIGGFSGTGNLLNAGAMQAVATTSGDAEVFLAMNGDGLLSGGNLTNAAQATMGASATGENGYAQFAVNYYTDGANSGTVAATANDRSEAHVDLTNGGTFTNTNTLTASETLRGVADLGITVFGSGGRGADITNTSAVRAVANTFGAANLSLAAEAGGGAGIFNVGTITATAISGGRATASLYADGEIGSTDRRNAIAGSAAITNTNLMAALADGGDADLNVHATGASNTITNTGTVEAVASGGTAYTKIGGDGQGVVDNSGGVLLARETAGTAFLDLGAFAANVSGGTLTTVGANAWLGVIAGDAAATSVTIAAKSQIVGWDGTLALADIAGSISAGTLVQAAKSGTVNITGNLSNAGTIEALGSSERMGFVSIDDGTGLGSVVNSGTIEGLALGAATNITISAGTVTNARSGVIAQVADDESSAPSSDVYGGSVVNSGTIMASASDSSFDSINISGGSITNAATGKIEALATSQSEADTHLFGSSITNAGLLEISGSDDSLATLSFDGAVNNAGGTIEALGDGQIYLAQIGPVTTITGGTLKTAGPEAAAFVTDNLSAMLNGINIVSGSLVLANDGGTLTLENGTVIGDNKTGTDAATVDAYAGEGNVVVSGIIYNTGLLIAGGGVDTDGRGGTVTVDTGATVSGAGGIGWVEINEFGTVNVLSGGSANVNFGQATFGTLEIADSAGSPNVYGGIVAGFGGIGGEFPGQIIELDNGDGANASAYTASYSLVAPNANPNLDLGTLTVTSNGSTTAVITLEGNYVSGAAFTIFNDAGNIGISDPASNSFFTSSNVSGATIVASATGPHGFARGVVSGGLDDTIKAIATSATTQAVINLDGSVDGGSVTADGNAQIYIDGATISGATLQTIGASAELGVLGGGTATVADATVSKGSFIFDAGVLTFAGGTAQADVTFLAYATQAVGTGRALTLSNTAFGAGDQLLAEQGGVLNVSATSGNAITFSAGSLVGAYTGGRIDVYGSSAVNNSGTIGALAVGGDEVDATTNVFAGSSATFTNGKGALVAAEAISGYAGSATVLINVGGGAVNSGAMLAAAGVGFYDAASLSIIAGTFTNEKGASVAATATDNGRDPLTIFGGGGVTNLGTITGTASNDSNRLGSLVQIATSGGAIVNSGAISVAAATNSYEGLVLGDGGFAGGSLTNAKGASITVSATAAGSADFSININRSGTLTNSGTMSFAATNDGNLMEGDLEAGAIVNVGVIDTKATNKSRASNDSINITGSSGGLTNSGGTIDALASNDSYAKQTGEFLGSSSLLNAGAMQAVATVSSIAEEGWLMAGGNLSNAAKGIMGASATGALSSAEFQISFYGNASNSGTIAASAGNRGQNAAVALINGGTFTNTNIVTASEVMSSTATVDIIVTGSGYSGANITNTSAMRAVANAFGEATLLLSAEAVNGASISNSGTITATASAGAEATAIVAVDAVNSGGSLTNSNLMGAIAVGGTTSLTVTVFGNSNVITNTKTIEAVANGGTAYTDVGNFGDGVLNNTGGTLLAAETSGAAYFDLGTHQANVSGGTLTTVGTNAWLGTIENTGSATGVTIAAKSQIVGWDGTLALNDIVGSISAGTLVQAAKDGEVDITGDIFNSGTIEALGNGNGFGRLFIDDATGSGILANSGTIETVATSGGTAYAHLSADTVTNSKAGTIQALANGEGEEAVMKVDGSTSIANSGVMLASASASSEATLEIFGGNVTNAATGKIEAIATGQSDAEAYLTGSMTNAGLIEASGADDSAAAIYLSGTINNSGGTILATGNSLILLGGDADAYNTTIVGGTLRTVGPEAEALVNEEGSATLSAVSIASGSLVLVEDLGTLTLANGTVIGNNKSGTDAATVQAYSRSDSIIVGGTVYNSGLLIAGGYGGGVITVDSGGVVSGAGGIGWVTIDNFGTVDVLSGGSANVAFAAATSGTLEIADAVGRASVYGGTVAGWGGVGGEFPGQLIDLANVSWVSGVYSASIDSNDDILTVTSGGTGIVATIQLSGNYTSASVNVVEDLANNTVALSDPVDIGGAVSTPATLASTINPPPSLINTTGASNVALLGSYMASMFAATEGGVTPTGGEGAYNQASLAAAHHT